MLTKANLSLCPSLQFNTMYDRIYGSVSATLHVLVMSVCGFDSDRLLVSAGAEWLDFADRGGPVLV